MFEIIIYFAIGACAGLAQYILDDTDTWKVIPVTIFWPIGVVICFFLIMFKKADE